MSDFDLYPGQGCRCGNDPQCYQCGSGQAYEEQIQQEEAARRALNKMRNELQSERGVA